MIEGVLFVVGVLGGCLVSIGWYKRGFKDMEEEMDNIKSRINNIEKDSQATYTDLEVIKQRMGYMEAKINEIHSVIMRPLTLN